MYTTSQFKNVPETMHKLLLPLHVLYVLVWQAYCNPSSIHCIFDLGLKLTGHVPVPSQWIQHYTLKV